MALDKIDALRARVAKLGPEQREKLRASVEVAGIPWDRVVPAKTARAPLPDRPPLSPAQMQFWLMQQVNPESTASAIAFSWALSGALDGNALERALSYLVTRHAPLRACFPSENGTPWQALRDEPFTLERSTVDVAGYPTVERTFAGQPFDLEKDPLFRAHLVRLAPQEHRLMVSMHHIIADGWSRGVLVKELAESYGAFREGRTPDLPDLSKSFAELVLTQRDWLQSDDANTQAVFWKNRLNGFEPKPLPTRASADLRSLGSDTILLDLDPVLMTRMRDGAAKQGATPFMLLLAVFKLLLHRYTGQTDLAVGTPTAGRRDPDAAGVIGLFVNTLVLRSELDPEATFTNWLAQIRQGFAESFDNQDLPFATVVDTVGPDRRAGQTPLFQTLFQTLFQVQTNSYRAQNASQLDLGDPDLRVTQKVIPLPQAKFDLSWHLMERETGFSLIAEYRTGLFDKCFIRRMARHFQTLLSSALDSPDCPVVQLDYLSDAERAEFVVAGSDMPIGPNVPDRISDMAVRFPDREALVFEEAVLSYEELDKRVSEIACRLRGHAAIKDGSRVVVALQRGPDLLVTLLASQKAGVVYVPLDPAQPDDRKMYILNDVQADLIITDAPISGTDCPQLSIADLESTDAANLGPVAPDALAYIIYTSGSTGRPKGVPIAHRNLSNLIDTVIRAPGLALIDRLLAVTTVGFDIAALELFAPLCVGGTVVLAGRETVLSPPALTALMQRQRISHMQATPALWRALVESGWQGNPDLTVLCGGEALDSTLARDILSRSAALWNMYGPTETTIWSAALKVNEHHLDDHLVPIGGPVANTRLQVLDIHGQALPTGIPGELAIGGAGLSPGYWNRPDLNADKFVGGLYRTGDLVVRQKEDTFRFLGRTDHQLKLNGFRVEPGEIEVLLLEQGLAEALVVLDPLQPRLIAYCRTLDTRPEISVLKRSLADQLPAYMVPSVFVFLDRFELNANGKIDRARLPAPQDSTGPATRAPQTETERVLHDIWCAVLGRDQIGVEDNFFDLGGASVSAMQIVARARDKGLVLEPAQLFEHQTIASQAVFARDLATPKALPFSPWQSHIRRHHLPPWLVALPAPSGAAFHIEQAISDLAMTYPVLRFGLDDGWLVDQHVAVETKPMADLGAWARAVISETSPWSVCLTKDDRLAVAVHPMLLDETAVERLVRTLRDRLDSWHPSKESSETKGANLADWLTQSQKVTPIAPIALPSTSALRSEISAPFQCNLKTNEVARLRATAQIMNADPERLVLSALVQCLGQWGNLQQIGVDFLTSTKPDNSPARMLGNLTRLLPLVLDRPQGDPARQVAQICQAVESAPPIGIVPRASGGHSVLLSWRSVPATDLEWLSRPAHPALPGYALSVEVELEPSGLNLLWHFDQNHIPRGTVENLAYRHVSILTALCTNPARGPVHSSNRLDHLKSQIRRPQG